MTAVMVTSPIVDTVAMRRPAMITGRASGSSTANSWRNGVYPIASAASRTSRGTEPSPSTVLRTRMSSVYRVSGTIAVGRARPVKGIMSTNSASDGIVNRKPVNASSGE